jgi:hypothetical protein
MMNAELVAQGQSKIIIPTVYRDDYLGVLRKLTRQQETGSFIKMLQYAWEFSSHIYSDSMNQMQEQLERCNAFLEHTEGKLKILKQE